MLKLNDVLYYGRRKKDWVPQQEAAVWPSKAGPLRAKGCINHGKTAKVEEFVLVPLDVAREKGLI
jgi:hypothetical protein